MSYNVEGLLDKIDSMTDEEFLQSLKDAGVDRCPKVFDGLNPEFSSWAESTKEAIKEGREQTLRVLGKMNLED